MGRGTTGAVYRASSGAESVALKVLRPELAIEVFAMLAQRYPRLHLVFVGDVTEVAYRLAKIEGGEGELPYTIVTYAIRDVLRGIPDASEHTIAVGDARFRLPNSGDLIAVAHCPNAEAAMNECVENIPNVSQPGTPTLVSSQPGR